MNGNKLADSQKEIIKDLFIKKHSLRYIGESVNKASSVIRKFLITSLGKEKYDFVANEKRDILHKKQSKAHIVKTGKYAQEETLLDIEYNKTKRLSGKFYLGFFVRGLENAQ